MFGKAFFYSCSAWNKRSFDRPGTGTAYLKPLCAPGYCKRIKAEKVLCKFSPDPDISVVLALFN